MRRFTMQDRSEPSAAESTTRNDLTLQQVFNMTDYSDEEFDAIADLQPGQSLLIGSDKDIYVGRTS